MVLPRLFSIFRIFLLAGFWVFSACQKEPASLTRPEPLPQDTFIKVYFNNNQTRGADYTEPYRKITRPGDDLETIIIDAINSANSTIALAVQEFRLPKVAQALAERHEAGVQVRVILENTYNRPWSSLTDAEVSKLNLREKRRYFEAIALIDLNKDNQLSTEEINERDALIILKNAGIPILDDTADGSKGTGLMHHKFLVIDNYTVISSSANLTLSGVHGDLLTPTSRGNANNLLVIKDTKLASLFAQEFNLMWGDGVGGKLDSKFGLKKPLRPTEKLVIGNNIVSLRFSPTSTTLPWSDTSNGLIGNTLKNATQTIELALYVFSEQNLADLLETRHQKNVAIEALIDSSFAFRNYSEGLDMLGVALSNKCQYEANNRPWQIPLATVGVPELPEGDLLHHKFAVVDGKTVITGSQNWSAAANHTNDETVLIIENPTVAAHFQREFARLYAKSVLGVPIAIQEKITAEEQECPEITTASEKNIPQGLININTATKKELETLPGIGPKLAQKVIETRQERPFTSLEDLQRVSGIGASLVNKLEGRVTW
ncbi:MAG: DUF655 domain-containing protein [Oscillatoria sp. PMC 1051.18]|nr:DUF655 domain-containing protein [Oscillatoria sp. PMC 1050.18]MEC5030483.1 DUF655 domain-containing protein [Oscillatoria sp. PMC 1051.18]